MALICSCWSHRDTPLHEISNLIPLIGIEIHLILVYGRTDVRTHVSTTRMLYAPGGPRPREHNDVGIHEN